MQNFKVSIIIPTYNRAKDLNRCLESLCQQDYKNFEVLVCDDGSRDNTAQVVEEFRDRLNLKYFFLENSGGPARPRNVGIENAKGEIIAFLDSDDWWTIDKLSKCMAYFENGTDLVFHDLSIVRNSVVTRKFVSGKKIKNHIFLQLINEGNFIANSSVMVKKDIIFNVGGIREDADLIACEDYDLWLRIAKHTNKFSYCPSRLGYYSESIDNISTNRRKYTNMIALIEKFKTDISILKQNNQYRYYFEIRGIVAAFREGEYAKVKPLFKSINFKNISFSNLFKLVFIKLVISIKN